MARRSKNQNSKVVKKALNLRLPETVIERLEELKDLSEADSLSEVVRRALSTYELLLNHSKKENGKTILEFPDPDQDKILLKII